MAISDAVGAELISRIVGYKLTKGNFSESSPNLPQRVAVLAEANTANQSDTLTTPFQATSAQQVGTKCGYGSPAYAIARILFPVNGGGTIGGIPVWFYPQAEAGGAAAKRQTITVSGTATAGGTHYLTIAGRKILDGGSYAINIANSDTATEIAVKITDAINNVLGCPVTAAETSPVGAVVTTTSKWKGLTANGIQISVDTGDNDLGLTYTIASTQSGTGTPTVSDSLALFGNNWNTIVINSYGFVQTVIDELQEFNGIPDSTTPTGRYEAIVFKPFIALTGTVLDTDTDTADTVICNAESTEVTIAACPAPLSAGMQYEAAANMCALFARVCQDTPNLDVEGKSYPDMPVATSAIAMESYTVRDAVVKLGMSTVNIVAGKYQVQDFVTTYHPEGEIPPQYRYCRDLMLDFNVRYGYYLLELANVVSHQLANDADIVAASNVIKPKQWKGILFQYATDLTSRGLIADTAFMQDSITVAISSINSNRFETFFRYKRTGVARICSTTAEAGFNFGNI